VHKVGSKGVHLLKELGDFLSIPLALGEKQSSEKSELEGYLAIRVQKKGFE
jgi:hypothetical protein